MRLALLATTALTLAACDASSPPAANVAEATAKSAPPAPAPEPADVELPAYAPLMPGGEINFASQANGTLTANLTAPGTAAEAMDFYEAALKGEGMNPARQDGTGGAGALYSKEKGRDVTISVGPGPTGTPVVGVLDKPLR